MVLFLGWLFLFESQQHFFAGGVQIASVVLTHAAFAVSGLVVFAKLASAPAFFAHFAFGIAIEIISRKNTEIPIIIRKVVSVC